MSSFGGVSATAFEPGPPLRATSRLTVEGARPKPQAIWRSEWPCTRPRGISSRSAKVSDCRERRRRGGWMPPVGLMWAKIEEDLLPKARAIVQRPCPCRHRSQISALSAAVKNRRFGRSRMTLHLRLKGKVLRSLVEVTVVLSHSPTADFGQERTCDHSKP